MFRYEEMEKYILRISETQNGKQKSMHKFTSESNSLKNCNIQKRVVHHTFISLDMKNRTLSWTKLSWQGLQALANLNSLSKRRYVSLGLLPPASLAHQFASARNFFYLWTGNNRSCIKLNKSNFQRQQPYAFENFIT